MKNPNYPLRNIRHAEVLTKAGFVIDEGWMKINNESQTKALCNCSKLIYWKHPKLKTAVCYFDFQQVTLVNLINKVIQQAQYDQRKQAYIAWNQNA